MSEHFDEEVYEDEVEYVDDYEVEDDGLIEEVEVDDSDGEIEENEADADDEDDQAGGGDAGDAQGKEQMLYIPGIGYIPLSSLGGIPGLNIGGRGGPAAAAPAPEGERAWKGLQEMPAVTQETIADLTGALEEDGKSELTILLLGKGGVGKSSTVNSILNERAANVLAFQQDNAKPIIFSRKSADGFIIHLIDTPSLLDQDAVSEGRLEAIGRAISEREIDAILYLDRLDAYSVDTVDTAAISGITRVLGPQIWSNALICLTRAGETSSPPGVDFDDHVAAREKQLKAAIDAAGGVSSEVGIALVENSSRCPMNADGEKVVAGEVPWLADLLEKIVEVALNVAPYEYRPSVAAKASDPGRRRKWLIPLVLAAQVAAKLLLDRVMDDDGCRGDANGPFDAQTVAERKEELKQEREREKKRKQKAKETKTKAAEWDALGGNVNAFDAIDYEDEDDEWDE